MSAGVMTNRWGWQPTAWMQDGLPTWRWRAAPAGLVTRRQMRELGRAPGGAEPAAPPTTSPTSPPPSSALSPTTAAARANTTAPPVGRWTPSGRPLAATTFDLTGRDRAILRAVATGTAEFVAGTEPDLVLDGRFCCDQPAAHRLAHAGLIAPARAVRTGHRVAAVLTAAGTTAVAS